MFAQRWRNDSEQYGFPLPEEKEIRLKLDVTGERSGHSGYAVVGTMSRRRLRRRMPETSGCVPRRPRISPRKHRKVGSASDGTTRLHQRAWNARVDHHLRRCADYLRPQEPPKAGPRPWKHPSGVQGSDHKSDRVGHGGSTRRASPRTRPAPCWSPRRELTRSAGREGRSTELTVAARRSVNT